MAALSAGRVRTLRRARESCRRRLRLVSLSALVLTGCPSSIDDEAAQAAVPEEDIPGAACGNGVIDRAEHGIDCGGECEPCGCDGTFAEPERISGLPTSGLIGGGSPSKDGRTLYFSHEEAGRKRLYRATRADRGAHFSSVSVLAEIDATGDAGAPHVTPDGLALYFFSEPAGGPGQRDLWVASRARADAPFAESERLASVSSASVEQEPWLGHDGLALWFVSDRAQGQGATDIWLATRPSPTQPFQEPSNVSELNTSAREEGVTLSRDGLSVIFASDRAGGEGDLDLWLALRPSVDVPFSEPVSLSELNTPSAEGEPRLAHDGRELFFSSNRGGRQELWRALRDCP